ncbi:uncharacterized protein LOC122544084 isoform X3 [Chiloscyllium plagiosum]|uniref:uncharacterized protein LOC122544084 isoform X3 n=1 Tax=Chiloscyllium plagiosum TaxID=36176 RepID=UPI001CB7FB5B|nr:uncharacterized protein LOC122544084 isoform X3 [Chiloscyllium plagiosum]
MDEMSIISQKRIAATARLPGKNSTEVVSKHDHSYLEDEGTSKSIRSRLECQHRENLRKQNMMSCKHSQNQCLDTKSPHWVSDIVRSLMQGNLLHGCSVLVTSRPWKMGNLTKTQINLRGEILGFNSENIKRYFRRCFGDEQLATGVMESIRQNETLYTMCYNPLYCSVLSSLLETRLREPEKQGPLLIPTSTEMFSAYITELLARCGYVVRKSLHKLKKIGELAWKGVSNKIVVFVSDQINQRELEDSNFISSFMMEIEDSSNVAYSFSHCVLQDFIAAVAKCLTTSTKGLVRQLDEGFTCSDNRFEIFSRFFTGLLSQNLNNQLENLLGDFPSEATRLVSVWLKDNIRRHIQKAGDMQSQRVFLQLLHCFIEFQDKPLISDTFLLLQSITLTQCLLKPSDCAALAFSFLYMEQVEELNLYACGIQDDCVRQLEPALPKCKILRLNRNDFGDSGINCLATALKKHDCKIQTLELKSNRLTDDSVEGLVSALVENSSLLELDLSNDKHDDELTNKLTEKCISSLYRLIKCKSNLKEIRLIHNRRITEEHQILNSTHLFNLVTVTDQDQNARMEILHSHDTDSKDTTHVISEEENPGPQENKHHGNGRNDCAAEGDNVAAAHNESMIAGPELSKHGERQQGSPSENDERPLGSMQPKQFQQDTLNQGELEGQNQNATMESLHSHDTDSIDTTHLIIEGENPGLQENKHHGNGRNDCTAVDGNVAAASIESTMAGSELSKDTVRHQGSPSENDEESVDSMHPKQFQKNALIQGELEHQEENTHMETIVIGDSSNEDVSPTNNLIEKWNPGLEEKKEHHSDTNTDGFDGDNKGNIGTLATAADIQQSKDSALQQDSIFKIKENMDENKEGNAMTATLCCKDNCNDIKLTAETNAESSRQLHPSGEHENSKNVSGADIPQSGDAKLQQSNPSEISKENVDKNKEENSVTEKLCGNDTCNDIKPTDAENAYSVRQHHPNETHKNGQNVSDISVQHRDYMEPYKREEFRNMTTDSASFLHNRETQDGANVQLPQKTQQDKLQHCSIGRVKNLVQFFSHQPPQNELDKLKSTPAILHPKIDPKTTDRQQKESISISVPSDNMPPAARSSLFNTAGRTKRSVTGENSDHAFSGHIVFN